MKKICVILICSLILVCSNFKVYATKALTLTVSNIDCTTNRLSWTKVDGATAYVIYVFDEETGKYKKISEIESTSCKIKNLKPNTKYTYKVGAKCTDGSIYAISEAASVYTINKYGSSYVNLDYEYSNDFSNSFAVQGETIYFISYPNIYQSNGKLYSIKTDGTDLKLLMSDCSKTSYLNVIGSKLYYYREYYNSENEMEEKYICSCNTDGSDAKIILDLSNEIFGEKYDHKHYDFRYLDCLYAVNSTLYLRFKLRENFETRSECQWYAFNINSGAVVHLDTINSAMEVNQNIISADENSITLGYNLYDTVFEKKYAYEYGVFQTFYTNDYTGKYKDYYGESSYDNAVEMSVSKKLVSKPYCFPYIDQNDNWYVCDTSANQIFPIKNAYQVYQFNDTIYYTDNNGVFMLKKGKRSLLCSDSKYYICYADNSIVILRKSNYFSNEKISTEYWTLRLENLDMNLIWKSNENVSENSKLNKKKLRAFSAQDVKIPQTLLYTEFAGFYINSLIFAC